MNIDILNGKKHIHFIGIGGSGMYPLAQILHTKGFYLTGSDNNETETLQAVRDMGIPVYLGQRAENIEGADLIVHTAAIMADNPELIAAKASGVPVLERSELLGIVTSWYDNAICVAGTHGKTTTTSMVTQILFTAGVDLSAFIGGKLPCIHGSGRSGSSDIMTCEACEFVDTFLKLYPDIAVLLNIDADHLDYFGTVENIIKSFHKFAQLTSKAVIYNGSDANTCKAMEGITGKECITFGKTADCDYYPANIRHVSGLETHFQLMHRGKELGEIVLHVAGEHNVLNATAAAAAAMYVGVSFADVAKGLAEFRGAGRRFEKKGEVGGITLVDDYAHHPTELTATLKAAMAMPFRKVWAVFQPFTFSRTAMLLDEFAEALSIPDHAVLTDIMGSREKNTYHIFTRQLGEKIPNAVWFPQDESDPETTDERKYQNFEQVTNYICDHAQAGDLVITLGCGDVNKVNRMILEELEHAKARGAKIYAELAGTGASGDAYHLTASHPEGLGAKLVMQSALEDAGMKPEDIDYINVHGTSTPVGDVSEVKAIKDLFGEHAYKLNISSTKSMTGHLLGATGGVEAIACVLSVKNDIVPPTINHEEGDNDENIDYNLNFTFNKAQQRTVRAALSNTFGFGGHNACVIIKKYTE